MKPIAPLCLLALATCNEPEGTNLSSLYETEAVCVEGETVRLSDKPRVDEGQAEVAAQVYCADAFDAEATPNPTDSLYADGIEAASGAFGGDYQLVDRNECDQAPTDIPASEAAEDLVELLLHSGEQELTAVYQGQDLTAKLDRNSPQRRGLEIYVGAWQYPHNHRYSTFTYFDEFYLDGSFSCVEDEEGIINYGHDEYIADGRADHANVRWLGRDGEMPGCITHKIRTGDHPNAGLEELGVGAECFPGSGQIDVDVQMAIQDRFDTLANALVAQNG